MTVRFSRRSFGKAVGTIAAGSLCPLPALADDAPSPQAAKLAAAIDDFGDALFGALADERKTLLLSPYNVAGVLDLLALGSGGATRPALESGLHLKDHGLTVQDGAIAARDLGRWLASSDGVVLEIANAIWAAKSVALRPAFVAAATQYFDASVRNADFASPAALLDINRWVSDKTHGKIARLLSQLSPQARVVLVGALYVKGRWLDPFDRSATAPAPFTRPDGSKIAVPMMHRSARMRYFATADMQVVALSFADTRYDVVVALPDAGRERAVAEALRGGWNKTLDDHRFMVLEGELALPRMKLAWSGELTEPLKAIGLGAAFAAGADFRDLSASALHVDSVVHKTTFELDEQGVVASAATGVMMAMAMRQEQPPFEMVVDRPYYLLLRERQSGAALFAGYIADPGTGG
jgi:serpin B